MKGASPSPEKLLVYCNFYKPLPLGPRLFWSGYQVALKEILSTLGPLMKPLIRPLVKNLMKPLSSKTQIKDLLSRS